MKFAPYYPEKPQIITRKWGFYDPADYHAFGYDYHNGDDCAIPADKLIHAPFDGFIVRWFNQPTGGGIGLGLLSDDTYTWDAWSEKGSNGFVFHFPAGESRVLVDFLHCEKNIIPEGSHVKAGDVIAIPDNTGFTTGPHTHRQWRRETLVPAPAGTPDSYRVRGNMILQDFDKNDANNSFNPQIFWNGKYAQDIKIATVLVSEGALIANEINNAPIPPEQKINLLQQLLNGFIKWFTK